MKVLRKLVQFLPKSMRGKLIRNYLINIPTYFDDEITIKLAEKHEELDAAFKLVYEAYLHEGLIQEDNTQRRYSLFHLLPSTNTVVAIKEGEVIGTFSLILEEEEGILPLDKDFDTRSYKKHGRRIGEVIGLAIKPNFRGGKSGLLFMLMKYLYQFSIDYLKVDIIQIATAPSRKLLYEDVLMFNAVDNGKIINDPWVNNRQMTGYYLDLINAKDHYFRTLKNERQGIKLYDFFVNEKLHQFIFPDKWKKTFHSSFINKMTYDALFRPCLDKLWNDADSSLKNYLFNLYKHYSPFEQTQEKHFIERRRELKFMVHIPASVVCDGKIHKAYISELSNKNLKLVTDSKFPIQQEYTLVCHIEETIKIKLAIEDIKGNQLYVMKILEGNQGFHDLFSLLEKHLLRHLGIPERRRKNLTKSNYS